jgi:hypothetical protein
MSIKKTDENYCATVAAITNIIKLDNCDNVVAAIVCGYQVIVPKNMKVGDVGVFFPVECQLSEGFLHNNNLYRHSEKNKDTDTKGYFEDKGRLKCVKFRGHKSEGMFMPLSALNWTGYDVHSLSAGTEFNLLDNKEVCRKYIIPSNMASTKGGGSGTKGKKGKKVKSRLIDGQFHLHINTGQLKKNIFRISPDSYVSISKKLHGTSAVFGNVLVKRKLSLAEKFAKLLGANVRETEYDIIYSSRNIIRNGKVTNPVPVNNDVYAYHADKLKGLVETGVTIYGEIVGYSGQRVVQKGYPYGCKQNESKFYVYRITRTDERGNVIELTRPCIDEYCTRYGLEATPLMYYGKAKDIYPDLEVTDDWNVELLQRLDKDESFDMNDIKCSMNDNTVPAEGCVVRIESMYDAVPLKLKNYAFYERETKQLDKGEVDMESEG